MRAGLMIDRIDLRSPTSTPGDYGPTAGWHAEGTVWAWVQPVTGKESVNGLQVQATITHRISIRYRPDVTSQWSATYRGAQLDFVSVINVNGENRELIIDAREHRTNG